MSDSSDSAKHPPAAPPRRRRWIKWLLAMTVIALAVAAGIQWWQDRQLAAAAEALQEGEFKYAMYLVTRYLERHPHDVRAQALQARALLRMGLPEEAIKTFDVIGAASAEDLHALANAFMLQEEWSSASPLLVRLLQLKPNDPDVLYELASCQMRLSQFDAALQTAHAFIEASGQHARGDVLIGSIYGVMRNHREAAQAFARVLEREPEAKNLQISPGEFYLRYGRVLMELGQPQEALMPLKLAAAAQESGEVFVLLGDAASQLGRPENAEAAWKRAVHVEPENLLARVALANAALLKGNGKEALEWLEPMREAKISSSVAYLFQRTYALLGDQEQASQWQEKTAELRREEHVLSVVDHTLISNPDAFWSRVARAHYFASEGNWPEADALISELIKEAPGDPFVIELADAIRRQSELPALSRIPVNQF